MDRIIISFHLNKQRSFNYGKIYVAISRAKTLQGMYALRKIEHKHVRANREVHEEYERLRNTQWYPWSATFPNMMLYFLVN